MSAMAAVIQSGRVHVLADAATYDTQSGVLTRVVHKIVPIPRANAVFVLRGSYQCYIEFFKACIYSSYESFDEFRRISDDVWRRFEQNLEGWEDCEIMVVGWSEEARTGHVLFRSTSQRYEDLPVGHWYFLEGVSTFGIDLGDIPPEDFDPSRHAIPAFEAARRNLDVLGTKDGKPIIGHGVGGWIVATLVTPGVEPASKIIHRWSDTIGEPIKP
ncbi:hypothetical protein [Ancylobacter sp. FA202]|uniref:hypothetical protein n=1 Tax=Ancylobacter sp. FA202 TaxID=1111106 RepID=UPI00037763B4|nr:hypothetical protein [Ancylobacter sp. FA202]